jgi:hypothetical protein
MDYDERDRPDDVDDPTRAPDDPLAEGAAVPPEPEPVSAADIESWPSQDTARDASSGAIDDRPAWPTEPPAAGSAAADAWPTSSPERVEPAPDPEPPPGEVEAYPAESAPPADVAPVAAAAAAPMPAHTVPDTEAATGESTQCPRCGTHNRAGVAFCQNCGANLRGTAPGYVPPAVATEGEAADVAPARRGAILGPVVLLIGVVGLVTAYLLPFLYGNGSLFDRAYGSDGYGIAFWNGYPDVGAELADQAYFGLAGPVPVLIVLLVVLAIAGFVRASPGMLQRIGLAIALLWSVGLVVLFVVVELAGNWSGDLIGMLRVLTPAGIIFFLASLIVLIGTLTRFGRA